MSHPTREELVTALDAFDFLENLEPLGPTKLSCMASRII